MSHFYNQTRPDNGATYVRARIDPSIKERAADALADMGLSVSDAIRLRLIRVADERRLMRKIELFTAFKRDYKRAKANPRHAQDVRTLYETAALLLAEDKPLP